MDFIDAIKLLARQWVVLLIGILLTSGVALTAIRAVPPQYQASGQLLLLLKPEATGEGTPTNPYLNLDGSLTTMAALIASTISTEAAQEELAESGFDAEVSVVVQPGAGPVITVTTADTSAGVALDTRDEVITRMQEDLMTLQDDADAPERQRIESRTIATPETVARLSGSKLRVFAGLVAVGGLLTLVVATLRDRRQQAGNRRSGERQPEDVPK